MSVENRRRCCGWRRPVCANKHSQRCVGRSPPGKLAPGTHLVETELSDALQISRGTLREAMRQLQQDGLISAGARGRLSVRHLDDKEIKDIFDVRAALESLAARELCELPDRSAAAVALRRAVAEMQRWEASNLEDRIEADLMFHHTLCHLTGNDTLLHSWIVTGRQHPNVDHVRRRRPGHQEHERYATPRNRRCHRNRRRRPSSRKGPRPHVRSRKHIGIRRRITPPEVRSGSRRPSWL